MTGWAAINEAQDGIKMMKLIQNVAYNQLKKNHMTKEYINSYVKLFKFTQGPNISKNNYYVQFKGLIESI